MNITNIVQGSVTTHVEGYEDARKAEDRTVLVIPANEMPAFREAIRRAMNTWQEPPQCIRDLDDIFEFGAPVDNSRSET